MLQDFDGQAQVLLYHLINSSIDGMGQQDICLEAKASPGRFNYKLEHVALRTCPLIHVEVNAISASKYLQKLAELLFYEHISLHVRRLSKHFLLPMACRSAAKSQRYAGHDAAPEADEHALSDEEEQKREEVAEDVQLERKERLRDDLLSMVCPTDWTIQAPEPPGICLFFLHAFPDNCLSGIHQLCPDCDQFCLLRSMILQAEIYYCNASKHACHGNPFLNQQHILHVLCSAMTHS